MSDSIEKVIAEIRHLAGNNNSEQHREWADRLTAIQAQGGGVGDGWPKTACGVADMANAGTHTIAKAAYTAPPAPAVPAEDKLPPLYADEPPPSERRMGYNQGWNACREAMLAAAPPSSQAKDGEADPSTKTLAQLIINGDVSPAAVAAAEQKCLTTQEPTK